MYKRNSRGWTKHLDFIVLDLLSLQLAFFLAYYIRFPGKGLNPYAMPLYRDMGLYLLLVDALVLLGQDTMRDVLRLGHWRNFQVTLKHTMVITGLAVAYLFFNKIGQRYSRLYLGYNVIGYFLISYLTREGWKALLRRGMRKGSSARRLLILADADAMEQTVRKLKKENYSRLLIQGIAVPDGAAEVREACGVPVVARGEDIIPYVCRNGVDEVLVVPSGAGSYPWETVDALRQMGVTVHLDLDKLSGSMSGKVFIEKIGPYTCLTSTINYSSPASLLVKRLMDILGGLVGCLLTGIIFLFVAPAIYLASPGPIFFAQTRVGRNGRTFRMYKFRSMYLDAEDRKAELMGDNKLGDGKMFKLDFDPRVIGNRILPDGTRKTGIGDFVRRTSLDEFPQFFNVLKGDMSIVGTRPPLPSETSLYELHHYARLSVKPGITGMWQVSGRSDITDFEEVVRLDRQYIENWNLGLDIKILLKTILVVFRKDGSA